MTKSMLQWELRQNLPFRSREQEAILSTFRTADALKRGLTEVVRSEKLTLQQYNVLRILRGAGENGLPTLEVAQRMVEQAPGITRFIDRLESMHLIRRERSRTDRRVVYCWITRAGLDVLSRLDPLVDSWTETSLGLTQSQLQELIDLLDRIRVNLAKR